MGNLVIGCALTKNTIGVGVFDLLNQRDNI